MFCPACKSEYREGYTRCNDCDVALVATLPPQPDPPEPAPDDLGPDSVVLYREDDPATLTAILAALQEAGIRCNDYPVHGPRPRLEHPFPMGALLGPLYEIRVPARDLAAAQTVLKQVLDKEDALVEEGELPDSPVAGPAPDEVDADVSLAKDTTLTEIWSGENGQVAGFLSTALRENGIPTRREELNDGDRVRFLVPAAKLDRAREIVREITEGAPPG
jgi:hypothetical protein